MGKKRKGGKPASADDSEKKAEGSSEVRGDKEKGDVGKAPQEQGAGAPQERQSQSRDSSQSGQEASEPPQGKKKGKGARRQEQGQSGAEPMPAPMGLGRGRRGDPQEQAQIDESQQSQPGAWGRGKALAQEQTRPPPQPPGGAWGGRGQQKAEGSSEVRGDKEKGDVGKAPQEQGAGAPQERQSQSRDSSQSGQEASEPPQGKKKGKGARRQEQGQSGAEPMPAPMGLGRGRRGDPQEQAQIDESPQSQPGAWGRGKALAQEQTRPPPQPPGGAWGGRGQQKPQNPQGPAHQQQPQRFPPGHPGYGQQQQPQRFPPGHPGYGQQQPQGPPQQQQPQRFPPGHPGYGQQQQPQRFPPGHPGYGQQQAQGPPPQGPPPGQQQQGGRQQRQGGVRQQQPQVGSQQPQQPREQQPTGAPGGGDAKAITSRLAATKISGSGDGILIQDKISRAGTAGRRIGVLTNHFELNLGRVKKVIHYDVDIQPDTPKKLLKVAFQLFKTAYFNQFNPAFDGRKNAYSARELPFGDSMSGKVMVEEQGMRSKEFQIKIQKVNVVDLESIQQFLQQARGNRIMEEPMEAIQAIDIVLRHSLSVQCINVGRSFFTPPTDNQIIDLGNGMEMYRGFFQSVTLGWKPFLNVDVANKAFPKSQAVVSLIKELCPRADIRNGLERWDNENFTKFIKGLRIEYNLPHKPAFKKRYRVNGTHGSAASIRFDYSNDQGVTRNVSVQEYYKMAYGIILQYPHLPCLWVGALNKEQKTYIACEFCTILPGQAVARKLDANQTRAMIKECATHTDVRKNSIKTSLERANYNRDPTVNEFDLKISSEFLRLDARVLVPPNLQYKQNVAQVRKGVWNASNFVASVKVQKWTILNLDNRTRNDALEKLASFLGNGSQQVGMEMAPPTKPYQEIKTFRNNRISSDLSNFFQKNKDMNIIFVVIPEEDKIYNYVKQAAEIAVGCLTQCLKAVTVFKKLNPATIGNILLKVNAKLNGANHTLEKRPPIMDQPTMIMGADVTHPSPDSRDIPSVAAVTASHDPKAFKYNICWRLQPPTVEIIEDLESITLEQMRYFCAKTGVWPKRIIFYRDGVSNGQFQQVLQAELQAIRRACSKVNVNCKPAITFIVVQKRHHTRFFPANPRDSEDRNNNVPAGTCVDTEIVHPTRQNFFLVSHASIQGVAKPTKYVTLWDDNDFNNDDLESLTYHLCHMFARCTRSVSYPAPTYYAHLAAARAKVYIETSQLNMNNLTFEQNRLEIKKEIVKDLPMFFV